MKKMKLIGLIALLLTSLVLVGCGPKEPDADEIGKKVAQQVTSESGVEVEFDSAEIVNIDPVGESSDNITVNVVLKSQVRIFQLVDSFQGKVRTVKYKVYKVVSDKGTSHVAKSHVYARYLDGKWAYNVKNSQVPTLPNLNQKMVANNILQMIVGGDGGRKKFVTSVENEITDFSDFDEISGVASIVVSEDNQEDVLKDLKKAQDANQAVGNPIFAEYKALEKESSATRKEIDLLRNERYGIERNAIQASNNLFQQFQTEQDTKYKVSRKLCYKEKQLADNRDSTAISLMSNAFDKEYRDAIEVTNDASHEAYQQKRKKIITEDEYNLLKKELSAQVDANTQIRNSKRAERNVKRDELRNTREKILKECVAVAKEEYKVSVDSYELMAVKETEETLKPLDKKISELTTAFAPYKDELAKKRAAGEVYAEIDMVLSKLGHDVSKVSFNQ